MVRCRRCRMPKWRGDVCANAECPTTQQPSYAPLRGASRPITANVKHGFHAEAVTGLVTNEYDAPIRARSWRS